ncbi:MAG: DapH/DapD/GlmU-related protein [Aulosira sp. ZfuVER01]|nr:DapH/DapD/GlmU-related protein [Aulosira sp. ZfuVER01]MDZ7999403.1 DapH/DapD/GlmU-related protein [Aulosira sp. DedVER01a]MDZ8055412.1 DapH/DapD/GlmU-related protein [Aulosira sp. ZfuCHP01]
MNDLRYFSKLKRFQQLLLITFLGDIPTIFGGVKLRNLMYRAIFARLGSSVYIQDGVEFISTDAIEIGNGAYIFKGVRIDGKGHENNRIHLENGVVLERNVLIGALNNTCIHIGQDTFIGPSVCIAGPGEIKIGKHCLIAAHTGIYANNHNFADPSEPIKYQGITCKGIVIEDDCWLGHGVKVLDGVTIGRGSVIGAGAVVTKDIPPFSVAVGVPARVIKSRQPLETIQNSKCKINQPTDKSGSLYS